MRIDTSIELVFLRLCLMTILSVGCLGAVADSTKPCLDLPKSDVRDDVKQVLFIGGSLSDFDRGSNHVDQLQMLMSGRMTFFNYAVRGDYIERLVKRLEGEPVFEQARYADIWSAARSAGMRFNRKEQ